MLEWVSASSNSRRSLGSWPSWRRTNAATSPFMRVSSVAVADPARAQCGEPGPWLHPGCTPVGRPEGDQRPANQMVDRHHSDPPFIGGKPAVEAVVAVVAHQEEVAGRNRGWREVVGRPMIHLVEDRVA